MTTLRDYLRDLVNEAIAYGDDDQRIVDKTKWVDDKVDEYIDIIIGRLIGGEYGNK